MASSRGLAEVTDLGAYLDRREGTERQVRIEAVADHFSVSLRQAYKWRKAGMPPAMERPRMVRYRLSECEAWVERHVR